MIVFLDSSPAGYIINPKPTAISLECSHWLEQVVQLGHLVAIPEIVDYELRRELLRGRRRKSLINLDIFIAQSVFVPIDSPVMRKAAEFWASARQQGGPTADESSLDGDMILAA